jgi:glycosyltransferase involved in cell wall biosynthesis
MDHKGLAEALGRLLANTGLALQISEQSRTKALQTFAAERHAGNIMKVYEELKFHG